MSSEYVILEKNGVILKNAPAGNWNFAVLIFGPLRGMGLAGLLMG